MTMPTQIDRFGNVNISFIGDPKKAESAAARRARDSGNTINHPSSFFVPQPLAAQLRRARRHGLGRGLRPERWAPGCAARFRRAALVVSDLAVLDFQGPDHAMRIRSLHPGVHGRARSGADQLRAGDRARRPRDGRRRTRAASLDS
jgi:glutaconate CoA-transferase subunit B